MFTIKLKQLLPDYFDLPHGTSKILPLIVLESLAMSLMFFISIYFTSQLNLNIKQVGLLVSSMSIGTCIGSLISGALTIKICPRKVSGIGLVLFGLAFLALSQATKMFFLAPIMFFCGLGGVFMMVSNLTALIRLSAEDAMKNRVIVIQSVIFNACVSISGIFLSMASATVIHFLFLVMGVGLLFSSLYLFANSQQRPQIAPSQNKRQPFKIDYALLLLIISMVCFYGIAFAIVRVAFPVEVISRFNNHALSGIILSANPFLVIFVQPLLIGSLKHINNKTLLIIGGGLVSISYFMFGISTYFVPSIIFIAMASLGEMIFSPISKKLLSISLGSGKEGVGIGIWKTTYYLSGAIGAAITGTIGALYGKEQIWYLCFYLSIASVLCFFLYKVREYKLKTTKEFHDIVNR